MDNSSLTLLVEYAKSASLLAVGLLIYAQLKPLLLRYPSWLRQILEGAIFSVLIAVTMAAPVMLQGGVRLDLRTTLVCLAVVFGGPLCGLVTVVVAIALRELAGGATALAGVMMVIFPYFFSLAYLRWIEGRGFKIGYRDMVLLGIGIDICRVIVWFLFLGYDFTLRTMDATWFALVFLVPCSVVLLGWVVLLVEERRSLAQTVADSEARFRSVLDQLPEAFTLVDREDRFTYVNRAWEAVTGISAARAKGKTRREIWQAIGSRRVPFANIEQVRDTAQAIRTDPVLVEAEGGPRWVVGTQFPVRNAKGEVQEIGTTGNEVTELVETREDLARREEIALRHKNALLDAVQASRTLDRPLDEAIQALTEIAGETLQVERSTVYRADFDARCIERVDLWERSTRQHLPREISPRTAIWEHAANLQREGVITIEDVAAAPALADRLDYLQRHDTRSLMIAPIFIGGRFFGVVGFATVGVYRRWTAEDMNFARSIADLIALMLVTNRHRESLAALDLIDDGIYVEGDDGRILYANRAALRMAGREEPNGAQQLLFETPPLIFPRLPRALADDHDRHEITLDLGAGPRELRIDRSALPRGGLIVVVHDITRRRAAQREREELEQKLMQAHKLEAIGEMAGGIAHDFNNLLGAVIGFARFLEEDLPRESDQYHYARRILGACERGKAVVTQILSFARVRNVERQAIDLHAVIEASHDLLVGLVGPLTEISFAIEDATMPILGNEGQVTQLLVNLCTNANDALEGEPGRIAVQARRVAPGEAAQESEEMQLSLFGEPRRRRRVFGEIDPKASYARIEVIDTGKGIPAQVLPRMFEPFFTTKHRKGGTGLGLAVVQSIVSFYDGALFIDSEEGVGTTFTIYLPLTALPLAAVTDRATGEPKPAGSERVLIVDDDTDVADMLSIGLGRLGYEVAAVNDPLEALSAFSEDPEGWDVAVLDRVMPEMDGITLAGRLRALRSGLPVILCTGLDDGTIDLAGGGPRGFDAFFTKPVTADEIAEVIRRLFDRP